MGEACPPLHAPASHKPRATLLGPSKAAQRPHLRQHALLRRDCAAALLVQCPRFIRQLFRQVELGDG